ncbi:putative lipid II flippase FtsW [Bartonella sp. HY406]|uniref:putative lipid II flippase FtsW n=1 Tax=Bartonella sp. HY406 TaxID=2979331 RepID=UPI0021CA286E|nr:putative lipid II flippase FtsW [Bartonella sp. HY406]UXN02599.1 putative lipid II flippase FtsW [Bartonella sp. HY406]
MVSRVDRGAVANWWWTIDRSILAACLMLMGLGVFLSFAASPAIASRIGIADSFHFVKLHIKYIVPAFVVMITISFFSPYNVRRAAIVLLGVSLVLLVAVLVIGIEIKGSKRWISMLGVTIQPSEFMKPAFVVVSAWLFAQHGEKNKIPGYTSAIALFIITATLLVREPDVGQTILITAAWGGLFFLAGIPWIVVLFFIALAIFGGFGAYMLLHHVRERIDAFLHGEGDTFQVDVGREAIINGGWFGQGPGEGTVKRIVPDAHTDFVFSVAAEEYGIILCVLIVALFGFIVIRSLYIASKEQDKFTCFAIAGIAMLFGVQSIINIAVNLHLMPPKGMTLPFISYGGSSLVAIGITMGFLLALTRKRPEARMSQYYSRMNLSKTVT